VTSNQRGRLLAALVAVCSEKGYEATRVADLLELSGVSRTDFYKQFEDKQACMLAAVTTLLGPTIATIAKVEVPAGEERARQAFEAFLRLLVEQAPAGRMAFVEFYAAGPEAAKEIDKATVAFTSLAAAMLDEIPGHEGMPPELVRALLGGWRKIIHTRLYRREEESLIDLTTPMWDWALSYTAPPTPLRKPRGRVTEGGGVYDPVERILRAFAAVVAEKSYARTTVGDVAERASISLSTFYTHFADKQEALLAAFDSGSAQMLATTLPAFRRTTDWPQAIRGAYAAMFAFSAAEPAYTTVGTVEIYAGGTRALEQRDKVLKDMEGLLAPGYERNPDVSPMAAEAISGAIYSMMNEQARQRGAQTMQELVPLATYVTLAPFIGAEEACAVANGDSGRGR
jgi:AcrR family transcriptional regulator